MWMGKPPAQHVTVAGVNAVLHEAAQRLALPSELSVPWAVSPYRMMQGSHQ